MHNTENTSKLISNIIIISLVRIVTILIVIWVLMESNYFFTSDYPMEFGYGHSQNISGKFEINETRATMYFHTLLSSKLIVVISWLLLLDLLLGIKYLLFNSNKELVLNDKLISCLNFISKFSFIIYLPLNILLIIYLFRVILV